MLKGSEELPWAHALIRAASGRTAPLIRETRLASLYRYVMTHCLTSLVKLGGPRSGASPRIGGPMHESDLQVLLEVQHLAYGEESGNCLFYRMLDALMISKNTKQIETTTLLALVPPMTLQIPALRFPDPCPGSLQTGGERIRDS